MSFTKDNIVFEPFPTIHNFIDLSGKRFGWWAILGYAGTIRPKIAGWWCECRCGTIVIVNATNLRRGLSHSCGCFKKDVTRHRSTTHGETLNREVSSECAAYYAARNRCNNPRGNEYHRYGGRGIEFRFGSFEEFLAEVGRKPTSQHSLDRFPDNDGHYEKGNVRWATQREQCRNRRSNIMLTARGKTKCAADWAKESGIHASTIEFRVKLLFCSECAIFAPLRKGCPHRKQIA